MTSGTGTCTVQYNQTGNASFNPAPQIVETVNAQKVDQTITVTKSAPATASVNSFFTVAATASSSLPVIYTASGVCTNVGDTFTMTSSVGICTVQYDQPGNTNYNAALQITEDVIANEGPAITSSSSGDFNVGFPGVFTITTTGNPTPTITQTGTLPAGVGFADNGDGTAILSGLPASGSGGVYDLVITASNGILPNAIQNFTLNVSRGPTITTNGLDTLPGTSDGHLDEGEVVTVGITQFLIKFSKDVNDPAGNTDPDDVTNPANYILLGNNGDGIQTSSCNSGVTGNDTVIPVNSINYNNNGGIGPFLATLNINGSQPLVDGNYRLIICGTTSIRDLAGVPLAGDGTLEGTDFVRNFVVLIATGGGGGGGGGSGGGGSNGGGGSGGGDASAASSVNALIPVTGFAPGRITDLSGLPVTRYKALGGTYVEIPTLKLKLPIVGVPMKDNTWDVNWLLNNVGWLEGSAFPGYSGNSVLTSHVTLQYGQPGPFADLHKLQAGDKILVHSFGSIYVYEVRSVNKLSPSNPSIMKHEETPWLTLFTCAEYYDKGSTYLRRLVVKAALVGTLADTYQSPGR